MYVLFTFEKLVNKHAWTVRLNQLHLWKFTPNNSSSLIRKYVNWIFLQIVQIIWLTWAKCPQHWVIQVPRTCSKTELDYESFCCALAVISWTSSKCDSRLYGHQPITISMLRLSLATLHADDLRTNRDYVESRTLVACQFDCVASFELCVVANQTLQPTCDCRELTDEGQRDDCSTNSRLQNSQRDERSNCWRLETVTVPLAFVWLSRDSVSNSLFPMVIAY